MGIHIAVCDDEEFSREGIRKLCQDFFKEDGRLGRDVEIQMFSSGKEILESETDFDILFLDIEMPGRDGIRIKEDYEENQKGARIIFTTGHRERMIEAFGKNVVSFLVKPIAAEDFQRVMEKTLWDVCSPILEIEEGGTTLMIPVREINYIEAQDKYTLVVTEKGEYLLRKTMKFWEQELPGEDFARIHKSYLVNLDYFVKKGEEVLLEKGKRVKISRFKKDEVMEKYRDFLRRKAKEQ